MEVCDKCGGVGGCFSHCSKHEDKGLIELLEKHGHLYDDDCGIDAGCSCGDTLKEEPYKSADNAYEQIEAGRANHARHLSKLILEYFDV